MQGVVVYKRMVIGVLGTSGEHEFVEVPKGATAAVVARRESKWESCLVAIGVNDDGTVEVREGEFASGSELPSLQRLGVLINRAQEDMRNPAKEIVWVTEG